MRVRVLIFLFCLCFVSCRKTDIGQVNKETKIPERIVALSPSSVEILYSLGVEDSIVAVVEQCNYPEEAKKKSVCAFSSDSSCYDVFSYNPDFVYLTKGVHESLIPLLQEVGIAYFVSDIRTIDDLYSEIYAIADIVGKHSEGHDVVNDIKKDFESINIIDSRPKVYWEVKDSPYTSVGCQSFINDLISKAGGVNVFQDTREINPIVSEERIILENPDIIMIPKTYEEGVKIVKARPYWVTINAVHSSRIYPINEESVFRPGPRIGKAILLLNQYLSK